MINKLKQLTFGVLLLFTSCQNNDNLSAESSLTQKVNHSAVGKITVTNYGNPYEFVGIRHNAFLDLMDTQPNIVDLNQIVDLSISFSNQNNFNTSNYITRDEMSSLISSSVNNPFMESINELYSQGKISNAVYVQLQNLGNILNNVNEQDGINILVQNIENLEQSCLLLDLNEIDEPVLLSVLSVAKYSAHYWREVHLQSQSTAKFGPFVKMLLNVAAVIGADIVGAAAGAAIGAGVAAVTGGVTASVVVPGMAIAVAGAASGYVAKDPPAK
jgi:hypothetical protein